MLVDDPRYDLPVAVPFCVTRSAGARGPEDGGDRFFRTLVEAMGGSYGEAMRRHEETLPHDAA